MSTAYHYDLYHQFGLNTSPDLTESRNAIHDAIQAHRQPTLIQLKHLGDNPAKRLN